MSRLLTPAEQALLEENGMRTDQGNEIDPPPVVKLFAVNGVATWLLTELSPFYPGMAFGLADLNDGKPELDNVFMPELETVQFDDDGGFIVEKDEDFKPEYPLSVFTEAAIMCGKITEDPEQLALAQRRLESRAP
ncbi:DUF2958 domain-containing protein [Dyadobacter jiangsuensis]|uniref:DUF2958 family protein n=1 Tax=Dyadobacter jiangsuensis TaxID=1591085 RepID=A0A2P8FP97_9BACT|nr:DUF2958 domain-containing protein [Dyadobacter jiangsuensis]PSL23485.1 Protein of unknown function (DUF2958) [Dyadobacter jiangsuensis]